MAARRKDPGDDLLSALIAAEDDGDRLDHEELLSLVVTLYSAGHRTTRDLFSNGLAALLREPEQLAAVTADPHRATEELVRFATPTHFVARIGLEPMEIGGVTIGALEPVLVMLAAANRDPRRFDDPEQLDVTIAPGRTTAVVRARTSLLPRRVAGPHRSRGDADGGRRAAGRSCRPADDDHGWWTAGPFRGLRSLRVRLP